MSVFAIVLTLLGCTVVYLTAKHQSWRAKPLSPQPWRWGGWGLNGLALMINISATSINGGIFAWLVLNMLCFGLLPFVGLLPYFKSK